MGYNGCCSSVDIREIVKKSYGERWSKEGQCCEPSQTSEERSYSVHEALMEELSPKEGMKILDVGSGTGDTVLEIAKKVGSTGKVVGVDFTPEGVVEANKKAYECGLSQVAEFRLADAENLPFEDGTFDAVISECVVCLIPDKQRALNEKVRVLKPGGRVIMHDVITWAPMPMVMRRDPKLYCRCIGGTVGLDDYRNIMKNAGLADIKTVDYTKERGKKLNTNILLTALDRIKNDKDFHEVVNFVKNGGIGYALIVGRK